MAKKNKGGRPEKITEAIVSKLETAFSHGCTDREACLYAGISTTTLYEYQNRNPVFAERKVELKETPVLQARTKVVNEIDEDVKTAQWYLERKKPDEFSPRQQVNVDVLHTMDDQQMLELFNRLASQRPNTNGDHGVVEAEFVETKQLEQK